MDLPRPPSHSAVSVEFLPISVLRRSALIFPKIPWGSRRSFFLISPLYLYCVFTRLSTVLFSLSFSRSFHKSFIFYFLPPRSPSCHPPGLYYCLLHARFLHGSIRLSWPLSVLLLFFRVLFLPSPTRWSPTISPSDLLPLRPRRGSRREITLINWSISKARSSSVRGYLRIYTLREGRKGVPQWGPVYKPYLHRAGPPPQSSECGTTIMYIARSYRWEHSIASRSSNVRIYLPSSILLISQPGGLAQKSP